MYLTVYYSFNTNELLIQIYYELLKVFFSCFFLVLFCFLQAVRTFKASGNLIITKQEKKIIITSFCGVISRLLQLSGGRWKGIRDLSGITLNLAIPLLKDSMVDRSIKESEKKGEIFWGATTLGFEVIKLIRYNLCNRLSLDSMFLPHLKERPNARTGGGVDKNSTDKKAHAAVEGQWVGGTTAGQTPAAIAAAQRLQLASDDVLSECDMNSLKLCLSLMTESSYHVITRNIKEEKGSVLSSLSVLDNMNSEGEGEGEEKNENENEDERENIRKESENGRIMIENAVIAVHSLLLGRGKEAAGVFILAALSEEEEKGEGEGEEEEDNKSDIKIVSENNKSIDDSAAAFVNMSQDKEKQGQKKSTNNDQNKSKIALKLQKIISNSEDKNKNKNENKSSSLIRLVAAKVIDVWYSAGGGMSKKLLGAEDHFFEEEKEEDNDEDDNKMTNANTIDREVKSDGKENDTENKSSKNENDNKVNNSDSAQEGTREGDEVEDEEVKETKRCEKIFQLLMGVEIAEEIVTRFKATGKEEIKVERVEEGREGLVIEK